MSGDLLEEQRTRYERAHARLGSALKHLETCEKYRRRFNRLKQLRLHIEPKWIQVRDLLDPAATRYLNGETYEDESIDDSQILDSAPRKMAQTAADGLYGGLASPTIPWFSLYVGDYSKFETGTMHEEKVWLNLAEECERDILANSNFYVAVHSFRKEVFEFGISLMCAYSDPVQVVRFFPYTVGSFWVAQNSKRVIDTVYIKTTATAIDIADTYGIENCPRDVKQALDPGGDTDRKFSVIQAIQPWGFFGGRPNENDYEYEDVHFIESGHQDDSILYRGGFRTKPFIIARWSESWESVYPQSCPGIDALPDIRQLYLATKHFNMAVEWASNPAWAVDATLSQDIKNVLPGQFVEIQGSGAREPIRALIPPVFNFEANMALRKALIENISGTFYNREIMMVSSRAYQNHTMTATEVDQLRQEKNAVMGPVNTRQSDPNKDILDRVFELITLDWNILEEPPQSLVGQEIKPYFTNDMAITQRQSRLQQANDVLAWMQTVYPVYPQIKHTFDWDRWAREFEKTDTIPSFAFNDPEKVNQLVQQEAQAMQQMQQMQMMQQASQAGKNLGATPTEGPNVAAELMNAQG